MLNTINLSWWVCLAFRNEQRPSRFSEANQLLVAHSTKAFSQPVHTKVLFDGHGALTLTTEIQGHEKDLRQRRELKYTTFPHQLYHNVLVKRSQPALSQPTLFELGKPENAPTLTSNPTPERPYVEEGLFLGTSAFTANGWSGSFYPIGLKPSEYLSFYATKFRAVEIDSTYYGTPSAATVDGWYRKTPPDFVFAAKVPQVVTHEKVLANCEAEFTEFIDRMHGLKEKLGPLLLQFPKFSKYEFKTSDEFIERLETFLNKAPKSSRLVVEIRNPLWLNEKLLGTLRERNVALALTDTSFMPRPWELKKPLDLITSDFAYVRWLGNRKQIETMTMSWDKTVVDRTEDLGHWVRLCRQIVAGRKVKHLFLFGNNHYQGHGPDTVKMFWELWNKK